MNVLSWLGLFKAGKLAFDTDNGPAALLLNLFLDFPPEHTSGPRLLIVTGKYDSLQFKLHPRHSLRQVLKVDHLRPSAFQGHRQLMQLEAVALTH